MEIAVIMVNFAINAIDGVMVKACMGLPMY